MPSTAPADADAPAASEPSLLSDRAFVAALVVAVVVGLGFGLVVPVVPEFARSFGVGLFAASAIVAAFPAVRLVSNLATGALADRMGRHRAVGWGAMIVALSSALSALAPSYVAFLLARGAGGFGSALFFNALLSLVVTAVPATQRGRALGMLQGSFLFGIAFGPSIGGMLAEPLGLRWPFAIYAVFCAAAGLVAFAFLARPEDAAPARPGDDDAEAPENEASTAASGAMAGGEEAPSAPAAGRRRAAPRDGAGLAAARQLLRTRELRAALLMMAASRWTLTGVRFALVPLFAREVVGASPSMVGFALTLASATHLALVWPAGRAADTIGRRALAWPSYLLFAAVTLALGWARGTGTFLLALAVFGIATALTSVTPAAVVGDVAPEGRSGTAMGVLNTAGDLGSVLGPLVCGWLASALGYRWSFASAAALLALASVAALRMRETLPARSGGDRVDAAGADGARAT